MKLLILFLILISLNTYAQSVGGGGSGGGGLRGDRNAEYIYNPHIRCKEGRREIWTMEDPSGDRSRAVTVVCKNGKWIPFKPKPIKIRWPWW
ncbi:hypothetical protein [Bdellovibrio sp. HCB-162]|uniref:hypothetical protein n=1 Tax=Bdellovibrio sp. HCB-162 TaxID=3394234 RepID=UPI0039BC662A